MNFSCDHCDRRYSVPDEKVQGRTFKVTCRGCGQVIVVRPGVAQAPAPPPPARMAPPPPPPPKVAPTTASATVPARAPAAPVAQRPAPRTADELDLWASEGSAPAAALRPADELDHWAEGTASAAKTAAPVVKKQAGPPDVLDTWASQGTPSEAAAEAPDLPAPSRAGRRRRLGALAVALVVLVAAGAGVLWWQGRSAPHARPVKVAAPRPPRPAPPPPAAPPAEAPPPETPPPAAPPPEPAAEAVAAAPAPAAQAPAPGPRLRGAPDRTQQRRLTAKDRRMLDLLALKGTETAPASAVERLDLDSGGAALDPGAVERVVGESRSAFSSCVSKAGTPGVEERLTLLLTVRPDGTVAAAQVAEANRGRPNLRRCVVDVGRRLVFPAFQGGEPIDVTVPLSLSAVQ